MNIFYTGFRACIENEMKSQKLSMNQIVASILCIPWYHMYTYFLWYALRESSNIPCKCPSDRNNRSQQGLMAPFVTHLIMLTYNSF
jgi:hypothetical protein